MNAQELVDLVRSNHDKLYVRAFLDLRSPMNVSIALQLLECSKLSSARPIVEAFAKRRGVTIGQLEAERIAPHILFNHHCSGALANVDKDPHFNGGVWDHEQFTAKNLFPRLEAHPLWLSPEPVVIVVLRSDDEGEVLASDLVDLVVLHLATKASYFRERSTVRRGIASLVTKQARECLAASLNPAP